MAGQLATLRDRLRPRLASLAEQGVFIGTSSWKYEGWRGQIYDEQRYVWRGKFAKARFERDCLAEYAETFQTVCVDAGYYRFPDATYLQGLASQVPPDFRFTFKVTDEITIKRFPNLERHGQRAGTLNQNFLNADLFQSAFLRPLGEIREKVGVLIFEFSHFSSDAYEHGRDFVADLDAFLAKLPAGWRYGVELRNRTWLQPDYFATLARYGVAHVFNSWQAMPPVSEQMALPASRTADFTAARFLLKPGRRYEQAVKLFQPYETIKEPEPEARSAMTALIQEAKAQGKAKPSFIYVNNRLEGSAPMTIAAILGEE
jgi:uncharacterized protein YecE (DUF72 family)